MQDKNNSLLIKLSKINDLDTLEENQIYEVVETISNTINIAGLKRSINNVCMKLSRIGPPCFGADMEYLALDNQKRLDLIFSLLDSCTKIELNVKNFRRNKFNCRENIDYLYNFITDTIDTLKAVENYKSFKIQEYKENMAYLKGQDIKLLN